MLWRACLGLSLYRFTRIHLIVFDWVRFPNSIELNQTEFDWVRFVRLNSICSEIELTECVVFDFVRLPNSIELNPWIEFDWVRLSSIFERSINYAGTTQEYMPDWTKREFIKWLCFFLTEFCEIYRFIFDIITPISYKRPFVWNSKEKIFSP